MTKINLKSLIWDFSKEYGQNAKEMEKAVLEYINSGMTPQKAVAKAFSNFDFENEVANAIKTTQLKAAGLGLGMDVVKDAVVSKALDVAWNGDGVTFSKRLHGAAAEMRNAMIDTIAGQLKLNASIKETAMALYDGYNAGKIILPQEIPEYLDKLVSFARRSTLTPTDMAEMLKVMRKARRNIESIGTNAQALKTAYKRIVDAVKGFSDKALDKAVNVAVQEKSRWIAERIARTESARAYFDGFIAKWADDDLCIAYKWVLGTAHDMVDICDMYSEADMFNLGVGIYPKEQVPECPVHPNCLCELLPVFQGEVDMGRMRDQSNKAGREWLRKLPEHQRRSILGTIGAANFPVTGEWKSRANNFAGFINPLDKSRLFGLDLQVHGAKKGTDLDVLPNIKKAIIANEKIAGYILADEGKGIVFKAALGYTKDDVELFKNDVLTAIRSVKAEFNAKTNYGIKYTCNINLTGPNGKTIQVTTIWQIDAGEKIPRFITGYPKERKK